MRSATSQRNEVVDEFCDWIAEMAEKRGLTVSRTPSRVVTKLGGMIVKVNVDAIKDRVGE